MPGSPIDIYDIVDNPGKYLIIPLGGVFLFLLLAAVDAAYHGEILWSAFFSASFAFLLVIGIVLLRWFRRRLSDEPPESDEPAEYKGD
jgi:membrane protein implicated in regulation of membrane protease activity